MLPRLSEGRENWNKLIQCEPDEDELIVVENGSTDGSGASATSLVESWTHPVKLIVLRSDSGIGHALRTGVLASGGERVLLTTDDLPPSAADLDAFWDLSADTVVAVGSRTNRSAVLGWLRAALLHSDMGDGRGATWVDGPWARSFAAISRETDSTWTVELLLAAEQQGVSVVELPVSARDPRASRLRIGEVLLAGRGIFRLAVRKDDLRPGHTVLPGRHPIP